MARHLSDEELLSLAEGAANPQARAHEAACPVCRGQASEARQGLELALEGSGVPEPPALYWDSFRRRLQRRIEAEAAAAPGLRPRGTRSFIPILVGAGVAAVAVLVAVPNLSRAPEDASLRAHAVPAWSALPPQDEDSGLAVLEGALAGGELWATAECRGLEDCLAGLTEEESEALADSLRAGAAADRL